MKAGKKHDENGTADNKNVNAFQVVADALTGDFVTP